MVSSSRAPQVFHRILWVIFADVGRVISTRCVPPTWRRRHTFEAISLGASVALPQRSARASNRGRGVRSTGVLKSGHTRASGLSVLFLLRQRYGMDANSVATKQQWQGVCHGTGARQRRGTVPAIHPGKQRSGGRGSATAGAWSAQFRSPCTNRRGGPIRTRESGRPTSQASARAGTTRKREPDGPDYRRAESLE